MLKPVLFGYLRPSVSHEAGRGYAPSGRTSMLRFALREGFTLGQVFVEITPGPPWCALESLLEAVHFTAVAGVLVPDGTHLGADPSDRARLRGRITSEAGVPVLAMQPATSW